MNNDYEIIKKIFDTDEAEKIRATVENFQLVELPDKVVEYFSEKLLSSNNGVKDTVARVLSQNKNQNIPYFIVPYVSSDNISARNLAGEILLNRKINSIDAMIKYLATANSDDKKFIIDILGLIGDSSPAQEIIDILMSSDDENVLLACVEALGNMQCSESIENLFEIYRQNELYQPTVIEALGKIGTHDCAEFLNSNYYSVDELTKYTLIESLGEIGNEESFNMLINDIRYLKGAYKWVAIESVGKLQEKYQFDLPSDLGLKNSLLETLETADQVYKKSAVRLVSLFPEEDVIEKVLSIYGNDNTIDQKLKEIFSQNLSTFFKKLSNYFKQDILNLKEIIELFKEMIRLDDGASLQTLSEFEIRLFVEFLSNLLTNPDEEIRAYAMELLFFFDIETALLFSDIMLNDAVSYNKLKLLDIIQYCNHPKVSDIIRVLENDDDEMVKENAQLLNLARSSCSSDIKE